MRNTELSTRPDLIRRLVPPHAEAALSARGIDIEGFVPIPLEQLRISLDVSDQTLPICGGNIESWTELTHAFTTFSNCQIMYKETMAFLRYTL